jgi:hypothetical protein
MGPLRAQLSDVQRHVVYDGDSDIPSDVYSLLEDIAHAVDALTAKGESTPDGMTRADALKAAREHVEAMSTSSRGYQDGVKLDDKVRAVDRFARFLMGESE